MFLCQPFNHVLLILLVIQANYGYGDKMTKVNWVTGQQFIKAHQYKYWILIMNGVTQVSAASMLVL